MNELNFNSIGKKKTMKTSKTLKIAMLALAGLIVGMGPVLAADTYTANASAYTAGVWTNDELVVSVTNGKIVGVTADRICLVPYGLANTYTNTFTLRTPYQRTGQVTIRVSDDATNAVKLATSGTALALGSDWIAVAGEFLRLDVAATNKAFIVDKTVTPAVALTIQTLDLAPCVTGAVATTVITPQAPAIITQDVVVVGAQIGYDSTGAPITNTAGAVLALIGTNCTLKVVMPAFITNATAATTLALQTNSWQTVMTNITGTVTYP